MGDFEALGDFSADGGIEEVGDPGSVRDLVTGHCQGQCNIGALIITIGFGGPENNIYNKEPPK